jgi:hypothetical protein
LKSLALQNLHCSFVRFLFGFLKKENKRKEELGCSEYLCFGCRKGEKRGKMTTEVGKVLYIVVVDEEEKRGKGKGKGKESFRYTRPVLQSTLQLMGCKARHAFKV